MFVVDLLSLLPDQKQVIRDIFQNFWDFQDRWNKDAPEHARDMITVAIKTAPQEVRQFSQIPILAWGVERVYTAYLIMGELSLARLAEVPGDKEMAARRSLRVKKGVNGMRDHMWDEPGVATVEIVNENSVIEGWVGGRLVGKDVEKPDTWSPIPVSYAEELTDLFKAWLARNRPAETVAAIRVEAGVAAGAPVPRLAPSPPPVRRRMPPFRSPPRRAPSRLPLAPPAATMLLIESGR